MLLAIGLLQVALVLRDQLAVDLAAREGARAAAVSSSGEIAAADAVGRALPGVDAVVKTTVGDDEVTISVHAPITPVPLLGAIVAGRDVIGSVTMALEPP